jgi:hypothetical protein
MARTAAALPSGKRTTDFISLGVIAKTFSNAKVRAVLAETGKSSVRQRELPAHVMACSRRIRTSKSTKIRTSKCGA